MIKSFFCFFLLLLLFCLFDFILYTLLLFFRVSNSPSRGDTGAEGNFHTGTMIQKKQDVYASQS